MAEEDNFLDDVFMSEERQKKGGYTDGFNAGLENGYCEGNQLGHEHGCSMGKEIGYYLGFASFWETMLSGDEKKKRQLTCTQNLIRLLEEFPNISPQDEKLQDSIASVRSQYKKMMSLLRINPNIEKDMPLAF